MESERVRRARLQRQEDFHAQSPGLYRWRLMLMAGLAQLGFSLALLLLVAVTLALLVQTVTRSWDPWRLYALILLGVLVPVLARAMFVRIAAPEGYALAPGEAPRLRQEIERIRVAAGAAPVDAIVIDERLNAAATYQDGVLFARRKHTLVLGLPLMHLLDAAELSAVIAHEFGHFRHDLGSFAIWVYRLRTRLHALAEHAHNAPLASQWLVGRLAGWFSRHFDEQSLVITRQQEYAADALAAQVAGAPAAASGLVRVHLAAGRVSEQFWPQIERTALAQPYPPAHVLEQLHASLAAERERAGPVPAALLGERSDPFDTHPLLQQRLSALGVAAEVVLPAGAASAAEAWLEPVLHERVQMWLEQRWQEDHRQTWGQRHAQAQVEVRRLDELEQQPQHSGDTWLELAELAEVHRPHLDVAGFYRQGLRLLPNHAGAHLRLGAWLLRQGQDLAGAGDALERAGQLEPALLPAALATLERYLRDEPASPPSLQALVTRLQAASDRHGDDLPDDSEEEFGPATLDEAAQQLIRRALAAQAPVARAWLLRQTSHRDSVLPHHILVLEWRGSVASEKATLPRLARQLVVPGTLAILSTTEATAPLRRLQRHAAAPFYARR